MRFTSRDHVTRGSRGRVTFTSRDRVTYMSRDALLTSVLGHLDVVLKPEALIRLLDVHAERVGALHVAGRDAQRVGAVAAPPEQQVVHVRVRRPLLAEEQAWNTTGDNVREGRGERCGDGFEVAQFTFQCLKFPPNQISIAWHSLRFREEQNGVFGKNIA